MQNHENVQSARHDVLIFLFIALHLTLTMCDPTERGGFSQEKPGKKKADDIATYKTATKQSIITSARDNASHHLVPKLRTDLFAEMDRLFNSLPNSKDKKWLESFLQKLKLVAIKLEKIMNLHKNFHSMNNARDQQSLILQSTPPKFLVSESSLQSSKTISNTPSKLVKSQDSYKYQQKEAVAHPVVSNMNTVTDSDKLVQELEALIQENAKQKKDFQDLISPKDIFDALHSGKKKETALISHNIHNKDIEDKMKFTDAGMTDRQGIQRLSDFAFVDQSISDSKSRNIFHRANKELLKLKLRKKRPNFRLNQQFHPEVIGNIKQNVSNHQSLMQRQDVNLQNGVRYFQTKKSADHKNSHGNVTQQHQHSKDISRALKQILAGSRRKNHNRYQPSSDSQLRLHRPSSYLYSHKWEKKLSPNQLSEELAYLAHQAENKQIDTKLSDEMKRELRDGKIIILSDSVVRSNFQPSTEEKYMERQTKMS